MGPAMRATSTSRTFGPARSAIHGAALIGGAIAWTAAALTGIVLALFFAATVVVSLLMAGVVLGLAAAAARARRPMRRRRSSDVIEARNMGGHSWVAYGWDGRR